MKLFGKDPAFWVGTAEGVIAVLSAFFLPMELAVILTTLVVALGGVLQSWTTKDTLLAALLGLVKAAAVLVVYLGYDLTDAQLATIVGGLTVILGGWLRTQTSSTDTAISRDSREVPAVAVMDAAVAPESVDAGGKVSLDH